MDPSNAPSARHLLLRSLTPSAISFVSCVFIGFTIVGMRLLVVSLDKGDLLPESFTRQWGDNYDQIVRPLYNVAHSGGLKTFFLIVAWSLVAVAAYTCVSYWVKTWREWRQTEHDIIMIGGEQVAYHPLRDSFMSVLLWRLGMVGMGIGMVLLGIPVVRYLWALDGRLMHVSSVIALTHISIAIVLWSLLAHLVVVWVRLCMRRTRLRGDIGLY